MGITMGGQALNRLYEDLGVCGWYSLGIFLTILVVGFSASIMFLDDATMSYTPEYLMHYWLLRYWLIPITYQSLAIISC